MANTQVAPGKAELAEMLRRKLTQAQIVAEWQERTGQRCSRSAIAMAIKRYGLESARPRPRYEELIPWKVRQEHRNNWHVRMLRLLGARKRGQSLSTEELRWLEGWLEQLNELNGVVAYEPDTDDGFFIVPRAEADGQSVVRAGRIR